MIMITSIAEHCIISRMSNQLIRKKFINTASFILVLHFDQIWIQNFKTSTLNAVIRITYSGEFFALAGTSEFRYDLTCVHSCTFLLIFICLYEIKMNIVMVNVESKTLES